MDKASPEDQAKFDALAGQIREEIGNDLKELVHLAVEVGDDTGLCVSRVMGGSGKKVQFFSALIVGPLTSEELQHLRVTMMKVIEDMAKRGHGANFRNYTGDDIQKN